MILLDTHALIWWVSGNTLELGGNAIAAIDSSVSPGSIAVSSISAWEIAHLVARGRLRLASAVEPWLARVGRIDRVQFVPVDNALAVASVQLPGSFHRDPADRIIVATARELGAVLVTGDRQIRAYPHVQTVW